MCCAFTVESLLAGRPTDSQLKSTTHANFHSRTVHLDIIKVFTPTDARGFLKGVLKFTLKQLRNVSV